MSYEEVKQNVQIARSQETWLPIAPWLAWTAVIVEFEFDSSEHMKKPEIKHFWQL